MNFSPSLIKVHFFLLKSKCLHPKVLRSLIYFDLHRYNPDDITAAAAAKLPSRWGVRMEAGLTRHPIVER